MLRNVTAGLLAAAMALTALAASPEIPQKALAQEARTRAAFTNAERARAAALEARLSTRMAVNDVNSMTRGETPGTAFVVMLAYLKLLQKEAREDRKIARSDASQASKAGKLDMEKEKVNEMKQEAGERYEQAMKAANLEMMMGIVSSTAAAASVSTGMRTPTPVAITPAAAARARTVPPPVKAPPKPR